MAHNFFDRQYYSEPEKSDIVLGICDPEGESCAYTTTDTSSPDRWCAIIHNPNKKPIRFTAIDKNMNIQRPNGDLESTCDGMIYASQTRELSFVELKCYHTGGATASAVNQLISTLEIFLKSHSYKLFNNRNAYACNPVHPHFKSSYREYSTEFRKKYHFRLLPQADIYF